MIICRLHFVVDWGCKLCTAKLDSSTPAMVGNTIEFNNTQASAGYKNVLHVEALKNL